MGSGRNHRVKWVIDKINDEIKSNIDLRKVAIQELKENKIPYIIKRPLPNNKWEYIKTIEEQANFYTDTLIP